jgi:hypothetical protein
VTRIASIDADYRSSVGFYYVKQGYRIVVNNLLTLLLVPLAGLFGMEIYVMFVTGELSRLWGSAAATNVQLNLVRDSRKARCAASRSN